jgi:hypothetical protein
MRGQTSTSSSLTFAETAMVAAAIALLLVALFQAISRAFV